jgi:hypothetical protein
LQIIITGDGILRESAHYSVARDLLAWLTETKHLYICDSSDDFDQPPGITASTMRKLYETNETWTWDLIRYAVTKLKHVEHFDIDRKSCCKVHLEHVFKWLNFPRLKSLEITSAESGVEMNLEDGVIACLLLVR